MAFFKLRKGGDEAAGSRQPESIEAIRRRARHRLIGAGVLVLVGVLGFPILFDTQPRPIAVDIPIEIPDRNKVAPLPGSTPPPAPSTPAAAAGPDVAPAPASSPAPATAGPVTAQPATAGPVTAAVPPAPAPATAAAPSGNGSASAAVATASAKAAPAAAPVPAPAPAPAVVAKAPATAPTPEAKQDKQDTKAPAKTADDGARAAALLEGKAPAAGASTASAAAAAEGRFVVQVGAFADAAKAREVRQKLEKAGLKTYTNVADTKDGKRIRVRLGPFGTRAEAEKAADKARKLDLQAALLTL